MALGALNRSQIRSNISTLFSAATGVSESAFIDLEAGPQGRAHLYWSLSSISSTDAGHRARTGTVIGRNYSLVVRYAHRVNPKDRETSRDAALDNLDILERAVRNSSNAARQSLEVVAWSDSERLSGSREWMVWDITLSILSLFNLAG